MRRMRRAVLSLGTAATLVLALAAVPPGLAQEADAAGDPRAGRRFAGGVCAACHGNDGIALAPDAPSLAGQNAQYTARQLRLYRAGERVHEQMSIVARDLTDAQVADLAAWYASIVVTAEVPAR